VREAAHVLGGRARTTVEPVRANLGPHVLYDDGAFWAWLHARGLAEPAGRLRVPSIRFRHHGTLHRTPPLGGARALIRWRHTEAPVDVDFRSWMRERAGDDTAEALSRMAGVFSFDHDPGRWSAAFVWERLVRVFTQPRPAARYLPGGWATLVERLAARAIDLGVLIETGAPVTELPARPVVLAVPLRVARRLLDDEKIDWPGTTTALLDLQLERAPRGERGPFIVSDVDEGGWVERFSDPDPSLAPDGTELVQAQLGVRPGETRDDAVARLERLVDVAYPGWRARERWRRSSIVTDQSGALEPPGCTWRDRPQVARDDGVYLAGDMTAAPGLLGEVAAASATAATRALLSERRTSRC
jgi:phytoene dehydrogenase-like protein